MPRFPTEHPARERDRARRHDAKAATVTGSDSSLIGPPLRELTGIAIKDWPPQVRNWYDAWRRSPQARLFVSDVEWESLGRAAFLLRDFYDPATSGGVRVQCANYVRNLEASLGATHTDRVKTHMKIKPPVDEEPAGSSAPVVDYRARLA